MSHVSQIGFDGAAAFASAIRPEIEAWCKAQALPNVKGVEGIVRDPDEAQANVRAQTCEIERRARDFEAKARNRRETAELWAVRTPGGVESSAPGVRYKKNHDRGCTMPDEFDNLDANEKAALDPRCIGVALLRVGSGKNSVRRSPSTLMTRGRLQSFTPLSSTLPRSLNRLFTADGCGAKVSSEALCFIPAIGAHPGGPSVSEKKIVSICELPHTPDLTSHGRPAMRPQR